MLGRIGASRSTVSECRTLIAIAFKVGLLRLKPLNAHEAVCAERLGLIAPVPKHPWALRGKLDCALRENH